MIISFFLVGLIIGSFLNSVIYRIAAFKEGEPRPDGLGREKRDSLFWGRSYCPHCRKTLSWLELIPVMSFIFQKGKCKHCQKKISKQYIVVEIVTGVLFASFYGLQVTSYGLQAIPWLIIISCLIIIFFYDLKHSIIPDQVVYFGIVVAVLGFLTLNSFLAALVAGAFFLSLVLISREHWMGMGDVKLAVFMGLILSWPNILTALFLAFFLGAILSIFLIVTKIKTFKSEIPFGPFLVIATFVAIFFGDILTNWYLGLLI